jgi:hypothetical protein
VCDKQEREFATTKPSLARRTVNYVKSYLQHVAVGRPEATMPQILNRLSKCVACKHYNPQETLCSLCGCIVNDKPSSEAPNKLGWADSICPAEPPLWLPIQQEKT